MKGANVSWSEITPIGFGSTLIANIPRAGGRPTC